MAIKGAIFFIFLFLFFLIIFFATAPIIDLVTGSIGDAADDAGVGSDVDPHMTSIASTFQSVMAVCAVGSAVGFFICLVIGNDQQEDQWRGGGGDYGL